ncbi:unnamed protein product [Rotaria sordida]|uniref:ABC transporter domain-containing protein n=1 Tax=Rotaria sordida TaxID=392033 RepID=A0A814G6F1_9BILA|nr:unnamed protein product [Rotaria sordida]CAF1157712.1 unnamed protein product [Rotaria sordida]
MMKTDLFAMQQHNKSAVHPYTPDKKRESCRLDWAESSWTRWIHVALWWWIKPILSLGNRRTLVDDDLSDISINDKCSVLLNKVKYDSSKWPGTWYVIRRTFIKDFFQTMLLMLAYSATRVVQPLLVREIILYISDTPGKLPYAGYLSAVGLGIISILQAITHQQSYFRNQRVGFQVKHGTLVGVKGAVGAGKSSLLAAILGEINLVSGTVQQHVRSISYTPQSSWIFADTIRSNILLGKPMNEERYKNVIKACCLDVDLQNFGEVGDLLMIGDKGVNLSGGQKARISLARALYADADLYLLDDPLAAVDPKVAKKIFDQCIGPRSLLRQKTRILVTHQIHFLKEANQTIHLANGHIDELHSEQSNEDQQSNATVEADLSDDDEANFKLNTTTADMNSIIKSEASTGGAVKWDVWFQLFTAPPLRWFYLGAGKSSLLQALFRLVHQSSTTGSILIDDIDIGCVSLDQLRSHLSVIPQQPILFCGTLRYNLDPFEQYSDEECLRALEAVQLKQLVRDHSDGLNQLVAESGGNLSAGERQLICVARAILKKSHILLIDEATAHVDHVTDSMIQSVIRDKFRDHTILTIAHRLNTIANSDRILMLEQGEIVYFDVPSKMNLT